MSHSSRRRTFHQGESRRPDRPATPGGPAMAKHFRAVSRRRLPARRCDRPTAQLLESRLMLAAQQVADLATTLPASSSPGQIVDVNGTAFFAASNAGVGRELYRSDGTPGGTVLVKDINPGPDGSSPSSLLNANGTLFFIATVSPDRQELWKSDGTAAGTVRVSDNVNLRVTTFGGGDPDLEALKGEVFFRGYDPATGVEVWKSDGTD